MIAQTAIDVAQAFSLKDFALGAMTASIVWMVIMLAMLFPTLKAAYKSMDGFSDVLGRYLYDEEDK